MLEQRSASNEVGGIAWSYLAATGLFFVWTLSLAIPDQPSSFLDLVNLAFHEAGHLVFAPFGRTLLLLGGTLLQLIVPAGLAGYFLARQSPFSAAACAWWLGENFVNVSVYMADARALRLNLVGGGEHDWNNLFYQFNLLDERSVVTISSLTHHLGVIVMLAATVWVGCLALPKSRKEAMSNWMEERFPPLRALLN
jgi:hypothetical protein